MTGINYGPSYSLQYDLNGRLSGMQDVGGTVATASYDAGTGLMTGLSYFGFSETRQYNSLMQMTRQTVANSGTNVMDMQYNFTPGANNGRISAEADKLLAEQFRDQIPNADQAHHFAAFLQLGYAWGSAVGSMVANAWEVLEGTSGNPADIALGTYAASLGAALKAGTLAPSRAGDVIRSTICNH